MQILFLFLAAGLTGDTSSQFQRIIDENPPLNSSISCSYIASSQIEGRLIEEHFAEEDGWRLLSVDGEKPSESNLKDYRKRARERENAPTQKNSISQPSPVKGRSKSLQKISRL